MTPLYDFRCKMGHTREAVRPQTTTEIKCFICGRKSYRMSVYRQTVVAPEVRYHGRDFLEASEMLESRRAEVEKREGTPVEMPDFFGKSAKRAAQLKRAGATDRDI